MAEDEVFIFNVKLCDNEIDRDGERFSHDALVKLAEMYVGKTGITDHNPKANNQIARIFEAEVAAEARWTSYGAAYEYVSAKAYMIRTEANANLIAEIEGGIKKEVSVSCTTSSKRCSVCGADKKNSQCPHVKGKAYGGKKCHTVLSDIADVYEWSFVAVPAQIQAGVTSAGNRKSFSRQLSAGENEEFDERCYKI